jgi:serine/threonine protein kinase
MHKYRLISKKGEGTFSEVLKAQSIKSGRYVAIKCMKNHFDNLETVNNLREIQALRRLSPHQNIVKLNEVLYDEPTGRLALVFELMDMNAYEMIRGRRHYLTEPKVKVMMYQLTKALDHMHRNGIFHRDIKPENILLMDDQLKLADFGSCRGVYSKQPYTEYISTRWYRAPECLLTDGYYSYKMDLWGTGCVWFEILSLFPLFPGTNELDQIQKIHNVLGTPPQDLLAKFQRNASHMDFNFPPKEGSGIARLIPHVSQECQELILRLLAYNPEERLSARQALKSGYMRDLREADKREDGKERQRAPEDTESSQAPPDTDRRMSDDRDPGTLPSIKSKGEQIEKGQEDDGAEETDSRLLPPIANASQVQAKAKQQPQKPNSKIYKSQPFKTMSHGFTTSTGTSTGAGIVGMPPPSGFGTDSGFNAHQQSGKKFGYASMTNFSTTSSSNADKNKKLYVSPYAKKR